jgi:hypothetical protein
MVGLMETNGLHWMNLYRAALTELDPEKLSALVAQTQVAIHARLRELTVHTSNHHAERQALADAINGLKVLRADEKNY